MGKQSNYSFTPRLMSAPAASHYLGVSPSKLRNLGIPAKQDGGNVLYERGDLDEYADRIAYRNIGISGTDECDEIFGRGSA